MPAAELRRAAVRPLPAVAAAVLLIAAVRCTGLSNWPCEDELRTYVTRLEADVLEGRIPGTAGYDSAAAYAARVLAGAGVQPGARAADAPTFLQSVPLVRNRVGPGTVLELRTPRGTRLLPHNQRTFLLLATGSKGKAEARAPVYIGNGLHVPEHGVDDLAGLDLVGRAVLMSASPPAAAELARLPEAVRKLYAEPRSAQLRRLRDVVERGAAAILLLPDRWMIDDWDAVSAIRNRLEYGPIGQYPGDVESPIPAAVLHADLVDRLFLGRPYHPISHAGEYRTFELEDIGLRLATDLRREPITSANVIGIVPGRDGKLRDEYVVVSAQLDGPGPGSEKYRDTRAASAPAALLEVAAALAADPPRRSVLFALFTAEAGGGWGSTHFMAHPSVAPGEIVAAIHVAALSHGSGEARAVTAFAAPSLVGAAREVAGEMGTDRLTVEPAAQVGAASSPAAFRRYQEAGIPSLLLARETAPGGMSSGSVWRQLDTGRLAEAVRALRRLIVEVADAREPAAGPRD